MLVVGAFVLWTVGQSQNTMYHHNKPIFACIKIQDPQKQGPKRYVFL